MPAPKVRKGNGRKSEIETKTDLGEENVPTLAKGEDDRKAFGTSK